MFTLTGIHVRILRDLEGINQLELAQLLGRSTVQGIRVLETGVTNSMKPNDSQRLIDELGVSNETLLNLHRLIESYKADKSKRGEK